MTVLAGTADLQIAWSDASNNESGFKIQRCSGASCADFADVGTVAANATTYTDTGLARNTTYTYRSYAYNGVGNSSYSNAGSGTTPDLILATPFTTLYKYDLLDNLLCVEQHGNIASATVTCANPADGTYGGDWRVRKFKYDALSHLTEARNPESGVLAYSYDSDGNQLTKSDDRGIVVNYSPADSPIDALHRVRKKTYSNGDPSISYFYDQSPSFTSLAATNAIGRRTGMTDASGQTAWAYDPVGRILTERRTINGVTKDISYTYNSGGTIASLSLQGGSTISYGYDAAGRPVSAQDTVSSINYASNASYTAPGTLSGLTEASGGSFGGYVRSNQYNSRMQPTVLSVDKPGQTILNHTYVYGAQNNGNIAQIVNNLDPDRSLSFTYDGLNRIKTAQSAGTDCSAVPTNPAITKNWGNSYTIDAWGNLKEKLITKCSSEWLSVSINTKNQIDSSGFSHDLVGNLTNYPGGSYTYDSENRVVSTAGATYVYDGDGVRVMKSGGSSTATLYWGAGIAAGPIAESDLVGTIRAEYVYFNGQRIARRDYPCGATPDQCAHYYFADHLNSVNVVFAYNGAKEEDADFYPYGGERPYLIGTVNHFKFTGKERDEIQSGPIDYFGSRYYGNAFGRFISPDFPFGDQAVANPQTWNLYVFNVNNPVRFVDPDGMAHFDDSGRFVGDKNGEKYCQFGPDQTLCAYWNSRTGTWQETDPTYVMDNGAITPGFLGPLDIAFIKVPNLGIGSRIAGFFGKYFGRTAEKAAVATAEKAAQEAAQAALKAEVQTIVSKAMSTVGNQGMKVSSKEAAETAAKEFVGQGAVPIVERSTGAQVGLRSADGTKIFRYTSVNKPSPYINLENKATGGNLHVSW